MNAGIRIRSNILEYIRIIKLSDMVLGGSLESTRLRLSFRSSCIMWYHFGILHAFCLSHRIWCGCEIFEFLCVVIFLALELKQGYGHIADLKRMAVLRGAFAMGPFLILSCFPGTHPESTLNPKPAPQTNESNFKP